MNKQRQEEIARRIAEQNRAEGGTTSESANEWARNTKKGEERPDRPPRREEEGTFARSNFKRGDRGGYERGERGGYDRGSDRKPQGTEDDKDAFGALRRNNPNTPRKEGEPRGPPKFSSTKKTDDDKGFGFRSGNKDGGNRDGGGFTRGGGRGDRGGFTRGGGRGGRGGGPRDDDGSGFAGLRKK